MKRLAVIILLLVVATCIFSCTKKVEGKQGDIDTPDPYNLSEIPGLKVIDESKSTFDSSRIAIIGFQNKKLWIGLYDTETKKKIWSAVSKKNLDSSITKTEYGQTTTKGITSKCIKKYVQKGTVLITIEPDGYDRSDEYFYKRFLFYTGDGEKAEIKTTKDVGSYKFYPSHPYGFYIFREEYTGDYSFRYFADKYDEYGDFLYSFEPYNASANGIPNASGGIRLANDRYMNVFAGGRIFEIRSLKKDEYYFPFPMFEWKFTEDENAPLKGYSYQIISNTITRITLNYTLKDGSPGKRVIDFNIVDLTWKDV